MTDSNQSKQGQALPSRSKADPQYTWDLTKIFPSDEVWEEAFKEIKQMIPQIRQIQGSLTQSAEKLLEGFRLRDQVSEKMGKVYVYAHLKKDQDSTDSSYVALENRAASLSVELGSQLSFFVPEILAESEGTIREYIGENSDLQLYEHALNEILRQNEHVLSASEESIIAQAGELAQAPGDIFTMINNADMKFPEIEDEKGGKRQLTHGRYIQFMESRDRRVRKDAFEAMYSTFRKQINTIATTLNSSVKKDTFYTRVRNYRSNLERGLFKDNIDTDVYENLIESIHEHLPLFQRYMKLRQRVLGVDDLHLYDVYVPLVKEVDMKYTYEEGQELLKEALAPLGEDYLQIMQKGFEERWIDVYENEGKRSGAYSSGTYGTPPYILLNYQDSLDHVYTLAHELGHSMHSYYSTKEHPYIYSGYTIFVAEVASTLNEALLTHYLLGKTNDPQEKMYILNHYLDSFRGTVFRQTMFAEFEKMIHEKVEQGEPLTPDRLSQVYYDLNVRYFGEDVVADQDIEIEWARIPHFYMTFYVYKYATGFAAAQALSQQILNEGQPAVERYLKFLKSGGSDYPLELLKKAGVDMASPEPVREALGVFEKTLTELEELFDQQK